MRKGKSYAGVDIRGVWAVARGGGDADSTQARDLLERRRSLASNATRGCSVCSCRVNYEREIEKMRMQRKVGSTDVGRRTFVGLSGAAALASLLPSRAVRAADPSKPRVLVVGDSMIAGGFGLFLARTLAKEHDYPVRRRGKSSSGLARPDFFDWIEEARRLVDDFSPDVSVVMFGGNDVQGLYMGKGEWIRWHEDAWSAEYARRVVAFCDILAPARQTIFWVGMPVMRPPKFHARVQRVNTIYRAEMAIRPNATFVDTWSVLADENGEYADRIVLEPPEEGKRAKRVRVRAGDGIHLSPKGAHHLKDHVLRVLLPVLGNIAPA